MTYHRRARTCSQPVIASVPTLKSSLRHSGTLIVVRLTQLQERLMTTTAEVAVPLREAYGQLLLPFGFLAWGGPMAQIPRIRRELSDDERWVSNEGFSRTLALYGALMQGSWRI